VFCLPLIKQGKLVGVLYLENNLAPGVFTYSRLATLELIASQAAISLEPARLYDQLSQENSDRKKAEEALRASEERLQDIIDSTTAVIFVKDLELRFLLVNREFQRRHRVRRDEIRGQSDFDIHSREVAEAVRANDLRVIEAGEPSQFEELVPTADGKRVCLAVKFLLRDRSGKPYAVCGIATDITESRRAEEMQAAMAREREMLVQQRAADLAKANEALLTCLDALALVQELDQFVGQVMAVITGQLGAASGALALFNGEQKTAQVELLFQDSRVMSPVEADYPQHFRSRPVQDEQLFAVLNERITVVHLSDPELARHSSLIESISSLKAQESQHLRDELIPEDQAVERLIEIRSRADVQGARASNLAAQIEEQQATVVSAGDDASNGIANLFHQLRTHRSAQALAVFDQHFEMPLGARFSKDDLVANSKPVRAIANLLPSAHFGHHDRPAAQRIAQLREFSKAFVALREVCEKEPGLVLKPVGGAPALSVVERAA
jgi:PAS domain S-box-containing protein